MYRERERAREREMYMYVCMYVLSLIRMCVYICVYIYMYTYTHSIMLYYIVCMPLRVKGYVAPPPSAPCAGREASRSRAKPGFRVKGLGFRVKV